MELSDIQKETGLAYSTYLVVSLALYAYFIAALLGRQFVPFADKSMQTKYEAPDVYFPFFTALQFCFYIGWLKVAEVLINPFGEDDDDIELNWLIDRHIKVTCDPNGLLDRRLFCLLALLLLLRPAGLEL
ncbi:hypothetical protein NQ317_019909 [Molorchus minor]|uniref:Bestrophin homolog n=1 Tax=Molorchus minor TaxID=1323400 RepID=A0ABQ9K673_9CUCU|nr:hypothetical protein NQ317_019909 [Molorchus minor]